ncbi:MAG: hypothetical protein AAF748_05625 [Pseudomonadota bacterium]
MIPQMQAVDPAGGVNEGTAFATPASYSIPQFGARPIVFEGSELAMAMSFTPSLPYWYEINLYRTTERDFVVAIRKFEQSEEEDDSVRSWRFTTLEEAFSHLEAYDAAIDVSVAPVTTSEQTPAALAMRALSLKADVEAARFHYGALVGELFAKIDAPGAESLS